MLKKIKKVGLLLPVFILEIYNTCFADVVFRPEDSYGHGIRPINEAPEIISSFSINPIIIIAIIGILGLIVLACTIAIIIAVLNANKKKEEKK